MRVIDVLHHPVHAITQAIHSNGACKHRIKYGIGTILMMFGSNLALSAAHWDMPHFAHVGVDVLAYSIHGLGSIPFVGAAAKKLMFE